jgi:N-acyl-D-amino-acid deacylase
LRRRHDGARAGRARRTRHVLGADISDQSAAQARGNELYIQITCQPLSFDFTLASAYPFYSHPAFDPIKAYDREQLKTVFRDPSFRDAFRADLRNPKPGTVFQGNWSARPSPRQ